ncbi:tetratricopeptide repeat protein (plasmid) [Nostoc sp. C057]|uniref:tetratricopeptide repeat protein n=1 Tax=Nostoc sp. C057 TaxID=2576903 RepID=UPI0015C3BD3B|nr:tetratricopeptide repeat protein [Nostoc sp. C057]QLE53895.1 tetratricopeptide repeat protein [Nostoc sp. C057]
MSKQSNPEQLLQSILQNVQVGGDLTTGDINQILNLLVVFPNTFKTVGVPHNVPYSATVKFVGRTEVLKSLQQLLQQNKRIAIAAIEGMGGVGKTELATQYSLLHLLLQTYPGGICWLLARDEDVGIQIVRFAEVKLGWKVPENWDLAKQVDFCWSSWPEGDVLVVLDDVNDYSQVEPYLPPQLSKFKVLMTTRLKLDSTVTPLTLDVFNETEALELLSNWVGAEKVSKELVIAKDISQRLGYLPLALNLMGRYINKRKLFLPVALRRLEEKGLRHASLDVNKDDRTWTFNVQRGVVGAFELSWEELSDNAKQLGYLLSLFALAPIPWEIIKSVDIGQNVEELEDSRVELENLHLIESNEIYSTMHQLIRDFFQDKLTIFPEAEQLKKTFASVIAKISKKVPDTYSITANFIYTFAPIIPHIKEVSYYLSTYLADKELILPFKALGFIYENQLLYSQAEKLYKYGLNICQQRFKTDHELVATNLNNLAYIYKIQGRYSEAEVIYMQTLEMRKKLLGEMHSPVAQSLNNLASVYRKQKRYVEAETFILQALSIRQSLLGKNHIYVAMSLNHLGKLYYEQERYSEAESFYIEVLNICESLSRKNHPFKARNFDDLALLYKAQHRYSEAESLYLKSINIKKCLMGNEHITVAQSFNNLSLIYYLQGQYNKAEYLCLEAISIYEKKLYSTHPDMVECCENLENIRSAMISINPA